MLITSFLDDEEEDGDGHEKEVEGKKDPDGDQVSSNLKQPATRSSDPETTTDRSSSNSSVDVVANNAPLSNSSSALVVAEQSASFRLQLLSAEDVDWNGDYQRLLERVCESPEDRLQRMHDIGALCDRCVRA